MALKSIQDTLTELENEQLDKFQREIVKALERLQTLVEVGLLEDIKDPLAYEATLQEYLNQSGYYKAVNNLVDNGFDVVYGNILDGLAIGGIAISYTQDDIIKINTLKQLAFDKFNALASETITSLKSNLYKYSLSNATIANIAQDMKTQLQNSNLQKYSRTYAETVVSDFSQGMINLKSQEYDGVWVYIGVNDGKTRPFCKHLLKEHKAYTDNEKVNLETDPKRRWNCRHHFWKVGEEWANNNGYK